VQTTFLRVVTEAGAATVPSDAQFVIGRARTADYVIADSRVSRRHLLLEQTGSGWVVRDISSNGTWIDGQRMPESVPVHDEVRLRLGTPTGPEVVVHPEFPQGRGGLDEPEYDAGYDMQRNLGDMYLADERFTKTYEDLAPGLTQWLRDSIHANADTAQEPRS